MEIQGRKAESQPGTRIPGKEIVPEESQEGKVHAKDLSEKGNKG